MANSNILIIILIILLVFQVLIMLSFSLKFYQSIFHKNITGKLGSSSQIRLIHQVNEAIKHLSTRKIGAIITITRKIPLDNLRTDGMILNANISSAILIAIFNKESPLHDGAVVIENKKIKYAGTYYKITQKSLTNKYGARHRAALGVSEQSDSITIVVSEENGSIAIAINKKLEPIKLENLQDRLNSLLN